VQFTDGDDDEFNGLISMATPLGNLLELDDDTGDWTAYVTQSLNLQVIDTIIATARALDFTLTDSATVDIGTTLDVIVGEDVTLDILGKLTLVAGEEINVEAVGDIMVTFANLRLGAGVEPFVLGLQLSAFLEAAPVALHARSHQLRARHSNLTADCSARGHRGAACGRIALGDHLRPINFVLLSCMPIKTNLKSMVPRRQAYKREITLMSHGFSNPTAWPDGKITVYPWDSDIDSWVGDPKRDAKQNLIYGLLEKVVELNGAKADDVVFGEVNALLLLSRAIQYSGNMAYESQCPYCQHKAGGNNRHPGRPGAARSQGRRLPRLRRDQAAHLWRHRAHPAPARGRPPQNRGAGRRGQGGAAGPDHVHSPAHRQHWRWRAGNARRAAALVPRAAPRRRALHRD
jgi:hypothetical protein